MKRSMKRSRESKKREKLQRQVLWQAVTIKSQQDVILMLERQNDHLLQLLKDVLDKIK